MTDWQHLETALASARRDIAAAAPDAATATEGEAYVARLLAAALGDAFLGHLFTVGGVSHALPVKGAPNPDYILSHAPVDPARRYRLTGILNGSERIGIGLYHFSAAGEVLLGDYAAFDTGSVDAEGAFSLEIASDAAGPGTLTMTSACRVLLVRTLHRDPLAEPGRVFLEGGAGTVDLAFAGGGSDTGYQRAGQVVLAGVRQFLNWSRVTSAHPNRFIAPPDDMAASVQGDPDTTYYLGYYQLRPGEWLEVSMPEGLGHYWSVHAYNHWCESLPGAGIHDLNAVADAYGHIPMAIGPNLPPGIANRIDTLGRHRGVLIFRSVGATTPGPPETRVHSLSG